MPRYCLKYHVGNTVILVQRQAWNPSQSGTQEIFLRWKPHPSSLSLPDFSKGSGICHDHHGQAALLSLRTFLTRLLLCLLEQTVEGSLNFWPETQSFGGGGEWQWIKISWKWTGSIRRTLWEAGSSSCSVLDSPPLLNALTAQSAWSGMKCLRCQAVWGTSNS